MANPSTPLRRPSPTPPDEPPPVETPPRRRIVWQGRVGPAFWTIASVISLVVNIILISIVLLLVTQIFRIKALVGDQLIGGLYDNFVKMDEAHIRTNIQVKDTIMVNDTIHVDDTIQVNDTMPVVFTLPLDQETVVTLTHDTPIHSASVYLNGSAVTTDLTLRQGTKLGIRLNMNVPVNQTIPVSLKVPVHLTVPVHLNVPVNLKVPVNLNVPVDIPLAQTELHEPFTGLQQVIGPYKILLDSLPGSWADVFCGPLPKSFFQ